MRLTRQTFKRSDGFRSGLEAKIAQQIHAQTGQPAAYELERIPYIKPESKHTYTPDFRLPNGVIVEAKGIFDSEDRRKHELIKAQHPQLDIRFVFSSCKKPINPGSPTSVAAWCEKRGFLYAEKFIPIEWFKEKHV